MARLRRPPLPAVAGLALAGLLAVTGCVAPPSAPEVDTAVLDEERPVDPRIYTVRIRSTTCEGLGVGSGFLVDDRTIVTNRHVVEGAEVLEVETSEGASLSVEVAAQGLLADLAIVRLDRSMDEALGTEIPPAVLADANPEPGDAVTAVGYPEGGPLAVTEGTVIDFRADPRLGNLSKVIRSDVEIHPGNSGGPAIGGDDRVIGVVYAIEVDTDRSLLVPVDTLRRVLDGDGGLEPVEPC